MNTERSRGDEVSLRSLRRQNENPASSFSTLLLIGTLCAAFGLLLWFPGVNEIYSWKTTGLEFDSWQTLAQASLPFKALLLWHPP